jgi:hypothetical protein
MSGSLKRALGLWVASKAPGLHVYSDDLANQAYLYPSCTVAEIDHAVTPLGCGKKDYKVRDPETHFVTAVGRIHQAGTSFRLTFRSPNSTRSRQHPTQIRLCLPTPLQRPQSCLCLKA